MIKRGRLMSRATIRSCTVAATLSAAIMAVASAPAQASTLGPFVNLGACTNDFGTVVCNYGVETRPGPWGVRYPDDNRSAGQRPQPLNGAPSPFDVAAEADLPRGETRLAVGRPQSGVVPANASAEARILDRITISGPAGPSTGTARLQVLFEGTAEGAGQFTFSAGFSLKDLSNFIEYDGALFPALLVGYNADWSAALRGVGDAGAELVERRTASVNGALASFVSRLDNEVMSGSDRPAVFGLAANIPISSLMGFPIEIGLETYGYHTGGRWLDFWNTARLTIALPDGFSLTSEAGLLSAVGGGSSSPGPIGVAEPSAALVLASGLLGFALGRRRTG